MEAAADLRLTEPPESLDLVEVVEGRVSIERLGLEDPTLAALIERRRQLGISPADTVTDAVEIGARVLDREATRTEVDLIKREFGELEHNFAEQARTITEQLDGRLEQFLGEDSGVMAKALDAHSEELTDQLAALFGDDRATAVQHQLREQLAKLLQESRQDLLRQFSAEDGHNPLADFKASVVRQMEGGLRIQKEQVERLAALEGEVKRLHDAREAAAELADERDRGTSKGREFEQLLFDAIERIAADRGDVAHHVGDERSASGGKRGDIVVEVDAASGPAKARMAFDAKDEKLSKNKAWQTLNAALEERDAQFAVLVVACEDKLPAGREQLHEYEGNKMIVAVDKHEPDERALKLAYCAARIRCLMATEKDLQLDAAGVRDAAHEALSALRDAQKIRSSLTGASRSVDGARAALDAMVDRAEAALERVESAIA